MPHLSYPNESATYRDARNKLLDAEIALRAQIEAVAVSTARCRRAAKFLRITFSSASARTPCQNRSACQIFSENTIR